MASFFTGFLKGVFGADGYMRDFQHASKLYRDDSFYDYAPKAGWLYYVRLQLNPAIVEFLDPTWNQRYSKFIGILSKQVDLPRFRVSTETLNQYNKKTVIQTKLNYEPVRILFHDDMANATTELWRNYFQYYYADGNYGITAVSKNSTIIPQYESRTRIAENEVNAYGLSNAQNEKFFSSIEIYLLNKKKFSSITLVNPIIRDWSHGTVAQDRGSSFLESTMSVDYETVYYNKGKSRGIGFTDQFYDNTPSPSQFSTIGGVIGGAADIFGEGGTFQTAQGALDIARGVLQTANLVKNATKITAADVRELGYSTLGGGLSSMIRGGPSPLSNTDPNSLANTFRYSNASVDPIIQARSKSVTNVKSLEFATNRAIQSSTPDTATSTPNARPIQPIQPRLGPNFKATS